jgi:precorrin-2/cobalt-factor-2 C20-methyltransferase
MTVPGTLHVVGVGPGDPELMTLKAARLIAAAPVVAYFAKSGKQGHARSIADAHIAPSAREIRLEYPYTTEIAVDDPRYADGLGAFYASCAARVAEPLDLGADVALLCEGDPFFYGSSLALLDRLSDSYASAVVPGVSGMSGCWTQARTPMTHGDDVLTVLPGTLDEERLVAQLAVCDAAVIMKVGRNFPKICTALDRAGLSERAIYVERGTMSGARVQRLTDMASQSAPYFSIVLVPGRQRAR